MFAAERVLRKNEGKHSARGNAAFTSPAAQLHAKSGRALFLTIYTRTWRIFNSRLESAGAGKISSVTVEKGPDLIVSFVVDLGAPGEVASINLLRTPIYERLLPEEERGVHVSHEQHPEREHDLLDRVRLTPDRIKIETVRYRYVLDVSRVDSAELADAHKVLRRMNFDSNFALEVTDVRW